MTDKWKYYLKIEFFNLKKVTFKIQKIQLDIDYLNPILRGVTELTDGYHMLCQTETFINNIYIFWSKKNNIFWGLKLKT